MITATTLLIAMKVIAVIGILAGMIILLIGIRHFSIFPEPEETTALRHEMKDENAVISSHSLFHDFLSEAKEEFEEAKNAVENEMSPAPERVSVRRSR